MVALKNSILFFSLAAPLCLAAPQPHGQLQNLDKRLFDLSGLLGFGAVTTSTTSSTTTSSSSIKTTSSSSSTISSSTSTKTSSTSSTSIDSTTSTSIKTTTSSSSTSAAASATASNVLVFSDLSAIVSTSDKLGTYTLSSYSASSCATLCAANVLCVFYDVYYAATTLSLIIGQTPYCALYSAAHTAADATDSGSTSLMTYSSSSGYLLKAVGAVSSSLSVSSTLILATTTTSKSSSTIAATTSSSSSTTTSASTSTSSSASTSTTSSAAASTTTTTSKSSSTIASTTSSSSSSSAVLANIVAVVSTSLSSVVVVPSTSISITRPTTTLAIATTSLLPSTTISSVSVSTSSLCAVPTWAYSAWCSTLPSMVPNLLANAAKPSSMNKGYLIPLYIYPSWWTTPGAWDWIYTAAANYPSVTFTVIINPASGPGTAAVPNSDYQHELAKMSAISNVVMLGYVDTAYGSRTTSAVSNDISIYAGWATSNSALAMDGIFFDNQAASSSYISMYTQYAAQVRSSTGFLSGIVGMAPGGICDPGFIDIADFTVIFEDVSANVKTDLFGWYSSFIGGLTTTQLSKLVFSITAADSTTAVAVANLQAALNPKYIYATDNTGSWGAAYQSAPSASFLTTALNFLNSPLSTISSLVAT